MCATVQVSVSAYKDLWYMRAKYVFKDMLGGSRPGISGFRDGILCPNCRIFPPHVNLLDQISMAVPSLTVVRYIRPL